MGLDEDCGSPKGCVKDAKPLHGNLFHALPEDTLPKFLGEDPDSPPVKLKDFARLEGQVRICL